MFFKKNLENKLKAPTVSLKDAAEYELKKRTKKTNMGHDKDKLNFPMENDCFNADDMSDKVTLLNSSNYTYLNIFKFIHIFTYYKG